MTGALTWLSPEKKKAWSIKSGSVTHDKHVIAMIKRHCGFQEMKERGCVVHLPTSQCFDSSIWPSWSWPCTRWWSTPPQWSPTPAAWRASGKNVVFPFTPLHLFQPASFISTLNCFCLRTQARSPTNQNCTVIMTKHEFLFTQTSTGRSLRSKFEDGVRRR